MALTLNKNIQNENQTRVSGVSVAFIMKAARFARALTVLITMKLR